jgi:site-specific DNA-adenine methylase
MIVDTDVVIDPKTYDFGKGVKPRTIFTYTGSKRRLLVYLIPLIRDVAKYHQLSRYIEPTGGSGATMFNFDPESNFPEIWYNDIDTGLASLMLAVGDVNSVHGLIGILRNFGVGEEVFLRANRALALEEKKLKASKAKKPLDLNAANNPLSLIERAAYTFISITQSRAAGRKRFDKNFVSQPYKALKKYEKGLVDLERLHYFLSQVKVTNRDVLELLEEIHLDGSNFILLDPPYHPSSMTSNAHYGSNSWSVKQHRKLVNLLLRANAKIILCGYDNEDYQELEYCGWRKIYLGSLHVSMAPNGKMADEFIWINFTISPYLDESLVQADLLRKVKRLEQEELR